MNESARFVREWLRASAEVKLRVADDLAVEIAQAADWVIQSMKAGGKLLLAGNGGSAADAQHIAAEFVGRFIAERDGLPAIALTVDSSALTAIGNDYGYDQVFRRQLQALGRAGDIVILITTSGGSENLIHAAREARRLGISSIGFIGKGGGRLAPEVDLAIVVPSNHGMHIQEAHIAIGHALCAVVETALCPSPVAAS